GFDAVVAEDGGEAVRTVRYDPPDLIIMDVIFPPDVSSGGGVAWDGFLIMDWLRRVDLATNTPFIVITGGDPVESAKRAQATGAVGFFQKPLDYAALIGLVCQILDSATAA